MSFSNIEKIEKYEKYVDIAINSAKKEVSRFRDDVKARDDLGRSKKIEVKRLELIKKYIAKTFTRIIKQYPSIDDLSEFYKEMVRIEIGVVELKKSLATLSWCSDKINEFYRLYSKKIMKTRMKNYVNKIRNEYLGRVSSVLKRRADVFGYLDEARKIFQSFPSIKEGMFTVAIAGYPNVGKSTLLSKVTSSKPKIRAYAFTTISLLTGYNKSLSKKLQFIDTPGTLNRRDAENTIERMSYCAIKYASDIIVFVFDPVLYDYEKQKELLNRVKKYEKDIIIYISKADIHKEEVEALSKKIKSEFFTDPKELLNILEKKASEIY